MIPVLLFVIFAIVQSPGWMVIMILAISWVLLNLLTTVLAGYIEGKVALRAIIIPSYAVLVTAAWVFGGFWLDALVTVILCFEYHECCDLQRSLATRRWLQDKIAASDSKEN